MNSATQGRQKFIDENFMLDNEVALRLYHEIAAPLPIIDYHSHISPEEIASGRGFANIFDLWIRTDPYKHRAMRMNGIPERLITGDAEPGEKFMAWAKTVPYTAGNPLFHWTALELKRFFDVDEVLCEDNAIEIWEHCNRILARANALPAAVLSKLNVERIATSDELLDELDAHRYLRSCKHPFDVEPSLRCDTVLAFGEGYHDYLSRMSESTGVRIENLDDLNDAIVRRIEHFHDNGCRLADHALDSGFAFQLPSKPEAESIFAKVLRNAMTDKSEILRLRSYLLFLLAREYDKRKWAMQLHVGAHRHTSSRLRRLVGPAGGYAAIGNPCDISSLSALLDCLEDAGHLPRTILYTLNPSDNEAFASFCGSFVQDNIAGKVQFGPAWWYNDHVEGIRKQLYATASYGLLSHFIGMTTDSRSILSLSRHEYFRRILCDTIGTWVGTGLLPNEPSLLERIVADISYHNIKNWLKR